MDVDAELTAWHEANAESLGQRRQEEEKNHRCPPDMPPCPDCQVIEEAEDEREYGV